MSIYRNEQQAIACAVGVDRLTTCTHSAWQDQYRSGFVEQLTSRPEPLERLTKVERLAQDAMTRALVKRKTDRMTFLALVAKYSADDRDRADAINLLADMVDSPAPAKMRRILIWAWACEAVRRGVRERLLESEGNARSTVYRWRKAIHARLDDLEKMAETIMSPELLERGLTDAA